MKYTIFCAYGEIIDKITILEIKLAKAKNETQKQHVLEEYNSLLINIENNKNDDSFKQLYTKLLGINKQLWILEDIIRMKSNKKEFDNKYIECAENIHIKNDERYRVKRELNMLYNSDIIEEKIYSTHLTEMSVQNQESILQKREILHFNDNQIIKKEDEIILQKCSICFENGDFLQTKKALKNLCMKYEFSPTCVTLMKIYFCYNTIMSVFNETNEYQDKIHTFINIINANSLRLDKDFVNQSNKMYGILLLEQKKYNDAIPYTKYLNPIVSENHNINPDTMNYFKHDDKYKTLLIYFSGGLGDIIMYSRFIKRVCEIEQKKNNGNKIIFLISDNLFWIYSYLYKYVYLHVNNIQVISFQFKNNLPFFDYHINITMLPHYLSLDYSDIYVDHYLTSLPPTTIDVTKFLRKDKKNMIINWSGNKNNTHEKHNRSIPLDKLITLFKQTNSFINWICLQGNILENEIKLLKKHNVHCIWEKIDKNGNSFEDTISLMRDIDLVISTDTSIVHVAGTANIPCWCLLTKGCDWRWTKNDETTKWYPNIKLIRQTEVLEWGNVVDMIVKKLKIDFNT